MLSSSELSSGAPRRSCSAKRAQSAGACCDEGEETNKSRMRLGAEEDCGAVAREVELGALPTDLTQELVVFFHYKSEKLAGDFNARENLAALFCEQLKLCFFFSPPVLISGEKTSAPFQKCFGNLGTPSCRRETQRPHKSAHTLSSAVLNKF